VEILFLHHNLDKKPNKPVAPVKWYMMLPEKTARMMYVKNREKIIRHKRGSFIANFYTNFDVLIKDYTDSKAEFVFNIPRVLAPETLDVAFSEALAGYLKYGKNHE